MLNKNFEAIKPKDGGGGEAPEKNPKREETRRVRRKE
jgi:hypothetical protein